MAHSPVKSTILFVIGSLAVGGTEKQLVLLAQQLVRRGWQVDIFCMDIDGPLRIEALSSGVRVHTAGWSSHFPRWRRTLLLAYSQWRLFRLARRLRPDVLHCFLPLTNFMGALAGWLAGVPKVITSRRALGTHQARHPHWHYADRIANRLSTHILANSQAVAADTIARDRPDPAKLSVIYNGIDPLPFRIPPEERNAVRERLGFGRDRILIGCVGNLIPYKGHADLISAFASAGTGDPRLTLVIVGEDRGIGKDLMRQAETLGVAHRVSLVGRRGDIPSVLSGFDVAVLPSHEEGFSNALLEMLSAGLPVIATAVGGNPEALAGMDGCILVPPGDPVALSAALRRIIATLPEDPNLAVRRRALIEQRYSIAAMIDNHERIYRTGRSGSRQRRGAEMPALSDTAYSRIVGILAIAYVLFIYSGAVDFVPDRMEGVGVGIARAFVYGFFALALGLAPVMFLNYRPAGLGHWGRVFVCYAAALLGVICYHLIATPQEGGLATKSFITAILHIWTFGFLFATASAARAMQLTTVMVILASGLFILAEIVVPSLGVLPGRGSGFYLNPNVAALTLLLGSLGALPSLTPLWRLPFLGFVGVIVFATLSRSGIIATVVTWAAWLAVEWTAIRNAPRDYLRGASIAVVVVAAGGLFFAFAGSAQFRAFTGKAAGPMFSDDLFPVATPERPPQDTPIRAKPSPPRQETPAPQQGAPVPRREAAAPSREAATPERRRARRRPPERRRAPDKRRQPPDSRRRSSRRQARLRRARAANRGRSYLKASAGRALVRGLAWSASSESRSTVPVKLARCSICDRSRPSWILRSSASVWKGLTICELTTHSCSWALPTAFWACCSFRLSPSSSSIGWAERSPPCLSWLSYLSPAFSAMMFSWCTG